jgi:hypothetical protein
MKHKSLMDTLAGIGFAISVVNMGFDMHFGAFAAYLLDLGFMLLTGTYIYGRIKRWY